MHICLAGRGDVTNPILWSGTPNKLYYSFSKLPHINIGISDWSLFKPLFSFYCVIIQKFLFIWGSACDPLLYSISRLTVNAKLSKKVLQYDYVLFCSGDLCISKKMIGKSKYAYYTDIYLADVIPFYKRKKMGTDWFIKQYNRNLKEQYNRCDIIFTQNEWTRKSIIEKLNIPCEKIKNIHFGVNLNIYSGFKNYDRNLLLIVLRKGLEEYKGLYLLLDAFKILKKRIHEVELAVVGTDVGSDVDGVTCYYNQSREVTVRLFKEATLYTMPAIREPNGITYLEGLANKAPIVGLNRFALPEFTGYGEWGFLCNNEDPYELANVIFEALSNKQRLYEMGLKGQNFVKENFNWEKVVKSVLSHMQTTIS